MAFKAKRYRKPYDQVFQSVIEALEECEHRIRYRNKGNGTVIGVTERSILSWGGETKVRITRKQGRIRVEGNATPTSQLFDWGESHSNLLEFFEVLDEILEV